ncbi:glycoside hydrolase [Acetobacterium wieringae]|uniref:glycoside hydrolase n=1 Tax=Acetobacterium wieringae TaxID=52694 RepID=UPI0026EF7FC9|nr:glycoside hydrolase [Acetobacterium wieringae]
MKNDKFLQNKDRKKILRSIVQIIVLISVLLLIVNATFNLKKYNQNLAKQTNVDNGFIAISYFGVDQTGDDTLIGTERLNEQLRSLYESGYVTITQQDIVDYYAGVKDLPDKSLFLIFEDGRRDTAIFAQEIMERYNFKATMLTYADKFDKNDPKFLSPEDLIQLEKSTFWELGTNGYRLEYINVFDRYKNFLGHIDTLKFAGVASYLGRDYNHYLMDYIRDEYGIPTESYDEMTVRINEDYDLMKAIYSEEINKLPKLYILMHSNTGQFATNNKVSEINEQRIKDLFEINFNREGNAENNHNSTVYDLSRLQPQSYWSANHLLMKIQADTNQNVKFVSGNTKQKSKWETITGESEFKGEQIILTSLPEGTGLVQLKDHVSLKNFDLSMSLKGNKYGVQKALLRSAADMSNNLSVEVANNQVIVKEKENGVEVVLSVTDLNSVDGFEVKSIDQDKKNAEIAELKTNIQYAKSIEEASMLTNSLNQKLQEDAKSIDDGSQLYAPTIDIRESGNRFLEISLYEDSLSIRVDNKLIVDRLTVKNTAEGAVFLESAWGGYGYSQRNLTDDVYDGVFEKIVITENNSVFSEESGTVIYDNCLHGRELFFFRIKEIWKNTLNWFIKTL